MHRAQAAAAVNIWAVATKKLIATTVIGPQNASAAEGGFAYVDLATPVVLQQGQAYYVTQTCHSNQPDRFTNSDADAGAADQRLAALGSSVYSPQGSPGVFPTQLGHGSQFAGVATFKTTVPVSGPCPFHLGIGPYRRRFTYVTPVLITKLRVETARQVGFRPWCSSAAACSPRAVPACTLARCVPCDRSHVGAACHSIAPAARGGGCLRSRYLGPGVSPTLGTTVVFS
jgi:hypothetical protein